MDRLTAVSSQSSCVISGLLSKPVASRKLCPQARLMPMLTLQPMIPSTKIAPNAAVCAGRGEDDAFAEPLQKKWLAPGAHGRVAEPHDFFRRKDPPALRADEAVQWRRGLQAGEGLAIAPGLRARQAWRAG